MKKEENHMRNIALKNECNFRSRSHFSKAYLGCDTCRLKKVKSNSKLSDYGFVQDKYKLKKPHLEKDERGLRNQKIKLTDLCDEDKKRIVELIEELSKLTEQNLQLKEKFHRMEKDRQQQQDYILRQANLFLEEKNYYLKEISNYKSRVESLETEMRNKISQWENHGKLKDNEVTYLAKALQKSLKEKNEMHKQMNHLKICLKRSLESFQLLKAEVSELQRQEERIRKYKSISCQTPNRKNVLKQKHKHSEEGTEEEEFSSNQHGVNKNSLDGINNKLEYVYQLLKKRSVRNTPTKKCDIDLSILLKDEMSAKEERTKDVNEKKDDSLKVREEENEEKFLKPFDQCSKTLVQAERILKRIEQPLNLIVNQYTQTVENNNLNTIHLKESIWDVVKCSNFLKKKIVQKNNLFKSPENHQYDEDQILEELFYSDQTLNLGLDSTSRLEIRDLRKNFADRPFTW